MTTEMTTPADTPTTLDIPQSQAGELQTAADAAREQARIQSALTVAAQKPRALDRAWVKLQETCKRPGFAEVAEYAYPRGGTEIRGLSIYFARAAKALYGNMMSGFAVKRDDGFNVLIEAYACDLETNTWAFADASFNIRIQRKKGGQTTWVTADERDKRELVNRHGALAERNCILSLLPEDFKRDAIRITRATLRTRQKEDPEYLYKTAMARFGDLGVDIDQLEDHAGKPLKRCTDKELQVLIDLASAIASGQTTWEDEYTPSKKQESKLKTETSGPAKTKRSTRRGKSKKAAEPEPPEEEEEEQEPEEEASGPEEEERLAAIKDAVAQGEDLGMPAAMVALNAKKRYSEELDDLTLDQVNDFIEYLKGQEQ